MNDDYHQLWEHPDMVAWVEHVAKDLVPKVKSSSVTVSIVPHTDKVDIKYAVELGVNIILDKPILVVAEPGRQIPKKLQLVADAIVYADLHTEEGKAHFGRELERFIEEFP